jgi:hypothetical protein
MLIARTCTGPRAILAAATGRLPKPVQPQAPGCCHCGQGLLLVGARATLTPRPVAIALSGGQP